MFRLLSSYSIFKFPKAVISILAGYFLSLSAPGYDFWFIAWIGLSPLFIIINTSKKIKEIILFTFLFALSYNIPYLSWLFSLHPLNWLGLNNFTSIMISLLALLSVSVYNSLFFAFYSLIHTFIKRISTKPYSQGILKYTISTFLWLIIFNKLSSSRVLLGFPWTLIEYSQYNNLYLIQIAEYFGSISISFLIVFFNLLLTDFLIWLFSIDKISERYIPRSPGELSHLISSFLFFAIILFACLIFGAGSFHKNKQVFTKKSKTICILQGNLPTGVTRGSKMDIDLAKKTYTELIQSNNAELIILPEGALPITFNNNISINTWLKNFIDKKGYDLISGTYCKSGLEIYNCAVNYTQLNKKFSYYKKERLVPFGEYTPFSYLLPPFLRVFSTNLIGEGFKEGKKQPLLVNVSGKTGINICFEIIFPTMIRKHALKGAKILINLSDLSWFSNNNIKKQFLSFGVFRAIENRKCVIIAANSGISAFIEPNGTIKNQSLVNSKGSLLDWVNPNNKITFYTKYGW